MSSELNILRFGRSGLLEGHPPQPGVYEVELAGKLWIDVLSVMKQLLIVKMDGRMITNRVGQGMYPVKMGVLVESEEGAIAGKHFAVIDGTLWVDSYPNDIGVIKDNLWIDGKIWLDNGMSSHVNFCGRVPEQRVTILQ